MKRLISAFVMMVMITSAFSQKNAFEIKVKLNNYKDSVVYLGNYYGSGQYIEDTAFRSKGNEFVFKDKEVKPGGIYLIITQEKQYFEILLDKEQQFSIEATAPDFVGSAKFKNSKDNELFYEFTRYNRDKYMQSETLGKRYNEIKNTNKDSASILQKQIAALGSDIGDYKIKFMKDHPNHLMSYVFKASKDVDVPEAPLNSKGVKDSLFPYFYYKAHYFDNMNFADDRILRTPVYHGRLENFFEKVVVQHPDSINIECDKVIEKSKASKELFKFTLWFLTNKYEKSQIMGFDAVFVHLVEKYYMTNEAYWVTPTVLESISKRAMQLKPLLIGKVAPELILPDTAGRYISSHNVNAKYTFILFWDTDCGHCKVEVPKIKKFYDENKKKYGIEVYSIDTDADLDRWKNYIRENNHDWINLTGTKANIDYHLVYDIYSTPVLFILDKDKKIIARRIAAEQLEDFMRRYDTNNK